MPGYPDFDSRLGAAGGASRRRRSLGTAAAALAGGTAGVVFLCMSGLAPAAVAIPVFLAVISLLLAAASIALFARVTEAQLRDPEPDADDDGSGPGGGWDEPPEPQGGGDLAFDWRGFERDFRTYCEQNAAIPA